MSGFEAIYVPIGVGTFELESAGRLFEESKQLLGEISEDVICPDEILLTLDKLKAFLDGKNPDLIILSNITFANAAYATEVFARFSCPVVLWTLREPVIDGTRLRLNSLTGAYSASNAYHHFRKEKLTYLIGSPSEDAVRKKLTDAIKAASLVKDLKSLNLAQIGHTPEGFGFGRALDLDMRTRFGVNLVSIEARELIDKARGYTDEEIEPYLKDASAKTVGLEDTPEKNRKDFARLYRSYREFVTENHIGALSSRCWPDFFTAFGTPVCLVLGMLNDLGVAASCEADSYGALSMYAGAFLSGSPCFFGDPVSLDEKESTITFWHCGTAAPSLARDGKACIGEHCNRHIGPTLEFGCKPEKDVTIFRIGLDGDGKTRIFLAEGEALDRPKQFYGTSVVVKTADSATDIVQRTVGDGWEPHFAVVKGGSGPLRIFADMVGVPVFS
ncbi:MAG: fucose isomerase [Candidatus Weimeria sp.]